jgi:hypothetical protein
LKIAKERLLFALDFFNQGTLVMPRIREQNVDIMWFRRAVKPKGILAAIFGPTGRGKELVVW